MKRPYLRRPGSRPPGRPRKTREEKERLGTLNTTQERRLEAREAAARPAALPAPTGSEPMRDRDGMLPDPSLLLSDEAEALLLEGLSEEACEVLLNLTDMFWSWSRERQIALRAFAECAATIRALGSPRRGSPEAAKLQEQRLILDRLADLLELSPNEVLQACEEGKGSFRE